MIRIGNAPTSWGIEKSADPTYPLWSSVLDEVAKAGYDGLELGPLGYLPSDPQVLRAELEQRGLRLSAANMMQSLADPSTTSDLLQAAESSCKLAGALGASYYVIIDGLVPEREETAGRSGDAPRLEGEGWGRLVETVGRLAEIAAGHGLVAAVHPHAGTRIEFRDEIERLLAETDPSLVHLCIDTGHATYAGIDPVELAQEHADRLAYVHLKDVNRSVRAQAISDRAGFWEAYRRGIFCILGTGSVDFAALHKVLADIGYSGWLTVEQDASPTGTSVPFDDAVASLAFLAEVGIVHAGVEAGNGD